MEDKKQFDVPILFIIFRRKDTALQVINAISKVKPKKLYISQDGPRNKSEEKEVLETRKAVLSKINWKCDLTFWTNDQNRGFKEHIPNALHKFFKENAYGIYLEDDSVPNKDFFYFEQDLLKRYENDDRIIAINGTNLYPSLIKNKHSYYLSQLGPSWGLGVWQRSWKLYDSNMHCLDNFIYLNHKDFIFSKKYFYYLRFFLHLVKENKLDAWDYQLTYAAIENRKYFLMPSKNMINNIGINKVNTNIFLQKYKTETDSTKLTNIKHPKRLIYMKSKDKKYFSKMYKLFYPRIVLTSILYSFPVNFRKIVNKTIKSIT